MEFTNEIFFNKPLIAGSTVIITYSGQLYREHSKDVSIVFGYGDNWNETDSCPMIETENGFEVTITLKDYNTFNFCFNNSFNIWDNNSGFNYIAPISPKQEEIEEVQNEVVEETVVEEKEEQKNDNNDDNTPKADGLGGENTEGSSSPVQSVEEEQTEENQSQDEDEVESDNTAEFESKQNDEIEAVFSSLLDSILDGANSEAETIDISNLPGFGLQSIDEIKEEDMINCDAIFAELFEELTEEKENVAQAEVQEAEISEYDKYEIQELDALMDNLLLSITEGNAELDFATPVQTVESQQEASQESSIENANLPATLDDNEDWIDKIINISYSFTKKVSVACKKIGSLIKLKAKEFGLLSDDNK